MSDTTLEADGSRLSRWVAPLVVLLSTLLPLYGLWLTQGAPMEEGFMLVFPEMVLDGQVPNRDFLHLYGPGSLWVLAAVFSVAGVSLASERLVGYLRAHDAATARWVLRVLRNEEINDPEMPRPWAVLMARLFQIFTDPDGAVKIADDAGAGDLFRRGAAAGLREVWTAATRNL